MKILSIDDSKMVHLVVGRTLKPYPVTLLTALNGEEGLAKAQQDKPDLILLDITMPVLNGLETLAKLKENPDTQAIPVIMLSADGGKDSVDKALQMGARHFITKPFAGDALIAALASYLPQAQPA